MDGIYLRTWYIYIYIYSRMVDTTGTCFNHHIHKLNGIMVNDHIFRYWPVRYQPGYVVWIQREYKVNLDSNIIFGCVCKCGTPRSYGSYDRRTWSLSGWFWGSMFSWKPILWYAIWILSVLLTLFLLFNLLICFAVNVTSVLDAINFINVSVVFNGTTVMIPV